MRAEPDGALTPIPEAPAVFPADATVTVDIEGLLALLDGSGTVEPEGDATAVAPLSGWLRS